MLQTAEIRWFFPEAGLESLVSLFPKSPPGDPATAPETRTDIYRVVPGVDIIGLKCRGHDRLELKALRAAPEPFRWQPPQPAGAPEIVLGRTDQWLKWTLPESNGDRLLPAGCELHVGKTRWTRRFCDRQRRLAFLPAGQAAPASGCHVERTELTLGRARWLTVAFEAFGDPDQLRPLLAETVRQVLAQATPAEITQLAAATSQSYPAWLDARVRETDTRQGTGIV